MKKFVFTMGFTALMSGAALNAQVTIGQDKSPEPFSVLELISNSTRGLRLPQLTQKERNALSLTFTGLEAEALGLQIFNINSKCVETWNGVEWIQSCIGEPPLIINPPEHYNSDDCDDDPNCLALDGFAVTRLADIDSVFTANGTTFTMKPVTGGVFYMGNQADNNTKPNYGIGGDSYTYSVHQVGLSSFYMGETEITQGLYEAVMEYSGAGTGSMSSTMLTALAAYGGNLPNSTYGIGNNYPAYYVCWYDAIVFCNRLSVILGRDTVYSIAGISTINPSSRPTNSNDFWNAAVMDMTKNGFRLPTEAEWEYAARGGQKNEYTRTLGRSGTQYRYSGSDNLCDVAWYLDNNDANTACGEASNIEGAKEVKSKIVNELGLYDMSGSIWEWCWNWRGDGDYPICCDEANPPRDAVSGSVRIVRGGYWATDANRCRVSYRGADLPYNRGNYGFRVVCK
jgi:formylglycine-generating enzyme required for sulfatase activity